MAQGLLGTPAAWNLSFAYHTPAICYAFSCWHPKQGKGSEKWLLLGGRRSWSISNHSTQWNHQGRRSKEPLDCDSEKYRMPLCLTLLKKWKRAPSILALFQMGEMSEGQYHSTSGLWNSMVTNLYQCKYACLFSNYIHTQRQLLCNLQDVH